MSDLFTSFVAVAIMAVVVGFLFLWAGIVGSLMLNGLMYNESIRTFTYIGLGLGGGLGCVGVWLYERKKDG